MKRTMNVILGNKRAVKMIVNFDCFSFFSEFQIFDNLGCTFSSHGTYEYEDQDDRLWLAATVCWREKPEQRKEQGHSGHT